MAGRTPQEAVQNFLAPLQQALSCVTREILFVRRREIPASNPGVLTLSNSPAKLGREGRFSLTAIQHYRAIEAEALRGP
jgi:hypothetical protein